MPQDPDLAAVLGAVTGPIGAGIYSGMKGDSIRQGLRGAGSTFVGDVAGTGAGSVLGAALGGLSGAGLTYLLNAIRKRQGSVKENSLLGAYIGLLSGGGIGGAIGRGMGANSSAKTYNKKLEAKRKFQKALAGGTRVNIYNGRTEREDDEESEENIKAAAVHTVRNLPPSHIVKSAVVGRTLAGLFGKGFIQSFADITIP